MTNIIRKYYNLIKWYWGFAPKRDMENPSSVQGKIDELNRREAKIVSGGLVQSGSNVWAAVPGYFAVTGFDGSQATPVFNASYGYTVKVFVNTKTGEVKMFASNLFEG